MNSHVLIGEAAEPDLRLIDVEDADEWRSELDELMAPQRALTVELFPSEDLGVPLPEAAEALRETAEGNRRDSAAPRSSALHRQTPRQARESPC
jgi:hypothetical protein